MKVGKNEKIEKNEKNGHENENSVNFNKFGKIGSGTDKNRSPLNMSKFSGGGLFHGDNSRFLDSAMAGGGLAGVERIRDEGSMKMFLNSQMYRDLPREPALEKKQNHLPQESIHNFHHQNQNPSPIKISNIRPLSHVIPVPETGEQFIPGPGPVPGQPG